MTTQASLTDYLPRQLPSQRDAILYGLARAARGPHDPFGHICRCRLCRALIFWYLDSHGHIARPPHPYAGPHCAPCFRLLKDATGAGRRARPAPAQEEE